MAKANGYIIYNGPSMLDGAPIVVIATGFARGSANDKTGGGLIQTWIIRSDVSPLAAIRSGDDASICGACPHRGEIVDGKNKGRTCYVQVMNAPLTVYRAFKRGIYPTIDKSGLADLLQGRGVRLGSYGDPAAVPLYVWSAALEGASFWTGYTHQWATYPELAQWCMASCDTSAERLAAKVLGFRTFRVRAPMAPVEEMEIGCPASEEMGKRTTCDACGLCAGTAAKTRKDITIIAHGGTAVKANYERRFHA